MITRIRERDLEPRDLGNNLVSHFSTWRARVPHKSEDLLTWKTILDHRNYLYTLIRKKLFKVLAAASITNHTQSAINEQDLNKKLNYLNDNIWNNLKYVSIERKNGYYGNLKTCINVGYLNPDGMENPSEIYMAYKEQVLILI